MARTDEAVAAPAAKTAPFADRYHRALRALVIGLAWVSAASVMAMVLVTSVDVVLRIFRRALPGAYDLVKIAALVAVVAALPYTTAIKGHVAIEFFFQKLGRRSRAAVDGAMRILGMALFAVLAWGSIEYGRSLRASGEVTPTLQLPVFWIPYVLAASCLVVILIKAYHLSHPGRSLLEP